MAQDNKRGHRQRLKERFISGDKKSFTDELLLELLLTYSIPQKDLQPLATSLIKKFGNMENLLSVSYKELCNEKGLGDNTSVLLKLVDYLRKKNIEDNVKVEPALHVPDKPEQLDLLENTDTEVMEDTIETELNEDEKEIDEAEDIEEHIEQEIRINKKKRGSIKTFNMPLTQESFELIPFASEVNSFEELQELFREKLPFNAESSKRRYTHYILGRFFPSAKLTEDIVEIARLLKGKEAFKDVIFYLIVNSEPMARHIAEHVIWPSMPVGKVERARIIEEISLFHSNRKTIMKNLQSIFNCYSTLGIAKINKDELIIKEREGSIEALTFILHRLFPEPGIYSFDYLTAGPVCKWLLWSEKWILNQLYYLRELGIVSKVSDIDGIKQFSTRYDSYNAIIELQKRMTGI